MVAASGGLSSSQAVGPRRSAYRRAASRRIRSAPHGAGGGAGANRNVP